MRPPEEEVCALCDQPPSIHCLQAQKNEAALYALVLDIHDGLVQNLFAAYSQVHSLRQVLDDPAGPPDARALAQGLQRVAALLENSLLEIRTFVRAFGSEEVHRYDLRTMVEGLAAQRQDLMGMRIRVTVDPDVPPPPLPVKVALYRILQEALANAYRHAKATEVRVRVSRRGPDLVLEVADNGQGFDPQPILDNPAATNHLGLRGMRERVRTLGGAFHIMSSPGKGTTIRVEIGCYERGVGNGQEGADAPRAHPGDPGR